MGGQPAAASSVLSDVPTLRCSKDETALKGWKEEGGEGGGKGRVELTRRAGRRGGKSERTEEAELDVWRGKWGGSHGQLGEEGGGSGGGGSARRDQFSHLTANQPRLPGGARSKLCVRVDVKVALMWGTLDPGRPGALWVPEF